MPPLKLSKDDTIRLIRLYKEQEILWNSDLREYRDKYAREEALVLIHKSLNLPNWTVEDIKLKIKYIRSTFLQEHNKVLKSKKKSTIPGCSNRVYIPTLKWYYEMASFIKYKDTKTSAMLTPKIKLKNQPETSNNNEEPSNKLSVENEPEAIKDLLIGETRPPKRKETCYIASINEYNDTKDINETSNLIEEEEDEYTAFGRHVSWQLRMLSTEQYLYAQEEIQNIITRSRFTDINNQRTPNTLVIQNGVDNLRNVDNIKNSPKVELKGSAPSSPSTDYSIEYLEDLNSPDNNLYTTLNGDQDIE